MKKWLSLFFVLCLIVSLFSCGRVDGAEVTDKTEGNISGMDTHGFARVMESSSASLLVCEFSSLGYAYVSLPRGIDGENFQSGDYVKITYGNVCETYPVFVSAMTIRHLTDEEIAAVYKEEAVQGTYIGRSEDGIMLLHGNTMYNVPTENLDMLPTFVLGETYEVIFDGAQFDVRLGNNNRIYFPISISHAEEEVIIPGGAYRFTAEIRKIADTYLEVYTEDENMRRTSDLFHVSIPAGTDVNSFTVGDTVEIAFAGAIEERYPANIKGTFSIELWHCGITEED